MPAAPEPIAIVASACILPGCPDKQSLWECIEKDDQRYGHAPNQHWRVDLEHALRQSSDTYQADYAWSDIGGYIRDDPSLSQSALAGLDPLQRWSIFCAEQCIREAELSEKELLRCDTIMGNLAYPSHSFSEFAEQVLIRQALGLDGPQTGDAARWNAAAPARSIKQHCQLHGHTINLDAACASGLYAMKIACDRLRDYRCDFSLAGAVNAADSYLLHVGFCALGAKSRIGQSRPFHQDADGLIPAEGAAVLGLQRLSDAQKQGKKILGIIHDIGLSNDGRSGGFLAPDSNGQYRAIKNAFKHIAINPADIAYVECHATGTPGGDHVELASLSQHYKQNNLSLSSLKANLGHLITVAGIAGVMKTLACMEHEIIPSCQHAFPLTNTVPDTFHIHKSHQKWQIAQGNRLAAVSAFGFGGNNAHAIISQYPIQAPVYSRPSKSRPTSRKIAILNINIINGDDEHPQHISHYAQVHKSKKQNAIKLNLSKTPFPPSDLHQSLGQQLLLTRSAELCMQAFTEKSDELGIYIGMDTDPDACRFCTRARIPGLLREHGLTAHDNEIVKNAFAAPIQSADVIGCMPNIPANRLHNIFNALGPGFSIADDERSGTQALSLAAEAIFRKEITYALVGAVDIARNPIHAQALQQRGIVSDELSNIAATCLICDATQIPENHTALAIIDLDTTDVNTTNNRHYNRYAHAADGLLQLLSGIQLDTLQSTSDKDRIALFHKKANNNTGISIVNKGHGIIPMPHIYCFSGQDIATLRQHIQSANTNKQSQHMRLAIVAMPCDFAEQQQLALHYLDKNGHQNAWQEHNIIFEPQEFFGEIASVYTGAASAYQHMLKDLILALPQVLTDTHTRIEKPEKIVQWVYATKKHTSTAFEELSASSFACQIHATLLSKFGIHVDATFGLSSGETNSIFAHGIWTDSMDTMFDDILHSGLYQTALAGTFSAVKTHLGIDQDQLLIWENWRILKPVDDIKALVQTHPHVWMSIINNDEDCVICGTQTACKKLIAQIDPKYVQALGHDMAVHCPVATPFADTWRNLHTRSCNSNSDIRFYSNYLGGRYTPQQNNVADALTGQALQCIDFRPIVQTVYEDGVRIFIEHGPRDSLSQSIGKILKNKDHRCLSFDRAHQDARYSVCNVAAQLWCLGKPVQFDYLQNDQTTHDTYMQFDLSLPEPTIDPTQLTQHISLPHAPTIKRAPAPPFNNTPPESKQQPSQTSTTIQSKHSSTPQKPKLDVLSQLHAAHQQYLKKQQEAFQAYLDITKSIANSLHGTAIASPNTNQGTQEQPELVSTQVTSYPGPSFSRQDLEHLASHKISDCFGPEFSEQDQYDIQVRMPEPPLLLCDRVLGIDAVPKSMGKGCIWTETDIRADALYMHNGHMAPGYFIEAGQADLLLISYLGIDFLNQGQRAYRLLGCELTFHGSLPKPGETLHYDIHIDGHAVQGAVRLFFFHYDCKIDGQTRLSVRNGQAGFFTKQELHEGGGLIWDPKNAPYSNSQQPFPIALCKKHQFSKTDIDALKHDDLTTCFGDEFSPTQLHTRTPNLGQQHSWFIDEVEAFEPKGGPNGRGYLKAIAHNHPDAWYFKGHFKNDPCMPGTLMAEACIQAMSFYLCACGATLDKDGWRFEPQSDEAYTFLCRGQVLPNSSLLTYELFVDELHLGQNPSLKAHVLASVDGKQAFLCEGLCLQLVQDFPLSSKANLVKQDKEDQRALAYIGDLALDHASLLHCAIGDPHRAFGPDFQYHPGKRTPRLPGEPYHFMTRILSVDGPFGKKAPQHQVSAVYDIPADAWYFDDHSSQVMPWAVLMEIALQPCGWLASYSGCTFNSPDELLFRNLDGTATPYRGITATDTSIRSDVTMHSRSQVGDTIIVSFHIQSFCDDELILDMSTSFGFFTPESMQDQKGLSVSEKELIRYNQAPMHISQHGLFSQLSMNKLRMIDRIDGFDEEHAWIRSQMDIVGNEWFFKAHFYQDPVQPGSLGIEAMLQTIHAWMLLKQYNKKFALPQIEAVCSNQESEWHYRGQVIPENKRVSIDADILQEDIDDDIVVHACVRLWVDGLKIYEAPRIALRMYEGKPQKKETNTNWELSLQDHTYLKDHCPNYMTPCLPMMGFVDLILTHQPQIRHLKQLQLKQWLVYDGNQRQGSMQLRGNNIDIYDEDHQLLARADTEMTLSSEQLLTDDRERLLNPRHVDNVYQEHLFHGPAFHLMHSYKLGSNGASYKITCDIDTPRTVLLDALLHGIPHDHFESWDSTITPGYAAYPIELRDFIIHRPIEHIQELDVEVRYVGKAFNQLPEIAIYAFHHGKLAISTHILERLLPKGPFAALNGMQRTRFLKDKAYLKGIGLSTLSESTLTCPMQNIQTVQWIPKTIEHLYGLTHATSTHVIKKDAFAHALSIHPVHIQFNQDETCLNIPLNQHQYEPNTIAQILDLNTGFLNEQWTKLGAGGSRLLTISLALTQAHIRQLVCLDPDMLFKKRPSLYLANHQVGIESFLFLFLLRSLVKTDLKALAKQEHQESWVAALMRSGKGLFNDQAPLDTVFFQRDQQEELLHIIQQAISAHTHSYLIHTEGTRSVQAGQAVQTVSSAIIDWAIKGDFDIVPVRFSGGLPTTATTQRLEFPYLYGKQDIHIGSPIHPDRLKGLDIKERTTIVAKAINQLGKPLTDDCPIPSQHASAIKDLIKDGYTEFQAVLANALRTIGQSQLADEVLKSQYKDPASLITELCKTTT